ncbi:MAG TPA: hypothetical protein DCE41_25340, partial [Cytophagales bacterium]|nr:hypothetical protein [Cytophagales bacterium]
VLGLAIGQLVLVLPQLSGTPDADVILSHLQRFDRIWSRGLSLFGVHLLGLGLLGWKAPRFPKVLAVLLLIAGLSYTGIHAAKWAAPEAAAAIQQVENVLALPMALGELALAVWLIIRGGRAPRG